MVTKKFDQITKSIEEYINILESNAQKESICSEIPMSILKEYYPEGRERYKSIYCYNRSVGKNPEESIALTSRLITRSFPRRSEVILKELTEEFDKVVISMLNRGVFVSKADYKEGQKKMIFGNPYTYSGGKWVKDGGSGKEEPKGEGKKEGKKEGEEPGKDEEYGSIPKENLEGAYSDLSNKDALDKVDDYGGRDTLIEDMAEDYDTFDLKGLDNQELLNLASFEGYIDESESMGPKDEPKGEDKEEDIDFEDPGVKDFAIHNIMAEQGVSPKEAKRIYDEAEKDEILDLLDRNKFWDDRYDGDYFNVDSHSNEELNRMKEDLQDLGYDMTQHDLSNQEDVLGILGMHKENFEDSDPRKRNSEEGKESTEDFDGNWASSVDMTEKDFSNPKHFSQIEKLSGEQLDELFSVFRLDPEGDLSSNLKSISGKADESLLDAALLVVSHKFPGK